MKQVIEQLRQFTVKRDWDKFHKPKDLAISVSIEAAELLELFQWQESSSLPDMQLIHKARDELADVFIYLLLLSDKLGIDLQEATLDKIKRNEERFPVATSKGIAKSNQDRK